MPVIAVVFHTEQPRIFHIGIGQHIAVSFYQPLEGCFGGKTGFTSDALHNSHSFR